MSRVATFVSGLARFRGVQGKVAMLQAGQLTDARALKYAFSNNVALCQQTWDWINTNPEFLSRFNSRRAEFQNCFILKNLLSHPLADAKVIGDIIGNQVVRRSTEIDPGVFTEHDTWDQLDKTGMYTANHGTERRYTVQPTYGDVYLQRELKGAAEVIVKHPPVKKAIIMGTILGINPELHSMLAGMVI